MTLAVIALVLSTGRASAQSNIIRFERLTVEHGLSQNAVLAVAQDHQGFLWFGTEDGLNQYDGYQFTVYEHDPEDPTSLIDSFISAILVDSKGEVWLGTRSGLDRLDRATGAFIHYPSEAEDSSGYRGKWVTSIYEDQLGTLWIGTFEGGLSGLDRETDSFSHFRHSEDDPTSLSGDSVSVIFEDSDGGLWVGTENGLDRYEPALGRFTHFEHDPEDPNSLSDNSVSAIVEDDQGRLWIGTAAGGISRFDPDDQTFQRFLHDPEQPRSLSNNRVRSLYQDHLGNLWIGTQNGLDLLSSLSVQAGADDLDFKHYRYDPFDPSSLGSNAVWSIHEDPSGVMWFGTWGGGISKYNRSTERFRIYQHSPSKPNSLSDNIVWSVIEDSSGILWIGTLNGGLNRLDRTTDALIVYRHVEADPGSLLSDDVRAVLEASSGGLWIGTAGGLDFLAPGAKSFKHYTHDKNDPTSLSGDHVTVLLEGRGGEIWIGTRYYGLNRLNPSTGEISRYSHDPDAPLSLGEDRVWALLEDHLGAIWVGTLGGISVLDTNSGEFKRYRHDPDDPASLSSDSIFAFHEDSEGDIWVGTWGGGLDRFDRETETFDHFTERDGLPNDTIYGIEADSSGYLWMSTNRGLSRFDPRTETFQNFDYTDGLQDNEFNVGAHSRSESGEMFFGGIRGFNAFFPDEIRENPSIPPIVITAFYIFNEPVRHDLLPGEQIVLSHRENFIAFEFASMDFIAPERNRYAYRLEGLEEDWIEAGTRRYVSYTNLEGGEYIFRVKGTNSDGVWNEQGVWLRVIVTPPFWDTGWFRGAAIFGIIGLVFAGHRLRVRGIEARSRELESLVKDRTHEIQQRKDELDALYRADGELFQHLGMEQVFQVLVDLSLEILGADKGSLLFWDDSTKKLVTRASRGFSPETLEHMQFSAGEGSVSWVMTEGEPAVISDGAEDSRLAPLIANGEAIGSLMHVPIQIGEAIYGVLSVAHAEPRGFGTEEVRLFTALAQRAALAIEQAQLQAQAQQAAVLEERQRLARDLHDAVTQTLFSASLVAEVLPTLWEKDPELGRSRLEALNELTKGALAEMRTLLIELRPAAIAEANLADLLRQLTESTTGRARIPVNLRVEGECELGAEVKVALYRVAQEALNNVVKHSDASQADLSLFCDGETVVLRVDDNGAGFDSRTISPDNLGLAIMRERAESIGAELRIKSAAHEGTQITLEWRG